MEMQNYAEKPLMTRMLIYLNRLHSQQPKRGQEYAEVMLSYLLAFTLCDVFGEGNYINEIAMILRKHLDKQASRDFEIVIVESQKGLEVSLISEVTFLTVGHVEQLKKNR